MFVDDVQLEIRAQFHRAAKHKMLVTGIQLLFDYPENHMEIWFVICFYQGRHFMLSKCVCLADL